MKVAIDSSFQNVELSFAAECACGGAYCQVHAEPPVSQGYIWQGRASLAADLSSLLTIKIFIFLILFLELTLPVLQKSLDNSLVTV